MKFIDKLKLSGANIISSNTFLEETGTVFSLTLRRKNTFLALGFTDLQFYKKYSNLDFLSQEYKVYGENLKEGLYELSSKPKELPSFVTNIYNDKETKVFLLFLQKRYHFFVGTSWEMVEGQQRPYATSYFIDNIKLHENDFI